MMMRRIITGVSALLLLTAAATGLSAFHLGLVFALVVLMAAWEWSRLAALAGSDASAGHEISAEQDTSTGYAASAVGIGGPLAAVFMAAVAAGCAAVLFLLGVIPEAHTSEAATVNFRGVNAVLAAGCLFWLGTLCLLPFHGFRGLVNRSAVVAVMGLLTLLPALTALLHLKLLMPGGWLVIFLVIQVAAADVGAFFAGRRFGGRRLAPVLSPNKTWAGVWGGLALCFIVTALTLAGLHRYGPGLTLSASLLLLISAPLVTLCVVVGDLLESLLKRNAGVKDSGAMLPGHGGLLDRVDGLLAAAPPAALLLTYIVETGS